MDRNHPEGPLLDNRLSPDNARGMHSHDFKGDYGHAIILANGDFSGDVKFHWGENLGPDENFKWSNEIDIPGELLQQLLERMIDYKLGDIGDDIAHLILSKISEP